MLFPPERGRRFLPQSWTDSDRCYDCMKQRSRREQQIMERTGHRSLEGVRSYKRTSDRQRRALSDVLNREQPNNQPTTRLATALTEQPAPSCSSGSSSCAFTSQQLRSLSLPSATFSDCNVNFFIGATTMESSRQKRRRPLVIDDTDSDTD